MRIQKEICITTISPYPRPISCQEFYTGINIIEVFSRRSSTEIETLLAEHWAWIEHVQTNSRGAWTGGLYIGSVEQLCEIK